MVFIPDCGEFSKRYVEYLGEGLVLAFVDVPETLERIKIAKNQYELKVIVDSFDGELIFIFDQWNALATGLGAALHSDIEDAQKSKMSQLLLDMSSNISHGHIIGASANDMAISNDVFWFKSENAAIYPFFGGLSDVGSYQLGHSFISVCS